MPLFLGVIFFFGAFMVGVIYLINNNSRKYDEIQENYFSSSFYKIKGKVSTREFLGGATFLLKIYIDSISLISTVDAKDVNYAGVYNQRYNLIYFLSENINWIACKDIEQSTLPINITIDSYQRKVFYQMIDTTYETNLRSYHIYTDHLSKYENDETVRF